MKLAPSSLLSSIFPTPSLLRLPCAGLDISDRAVKFVLLEGNAGHLHLSKFLEEEIPAGVIKQGVIADVNKLSGVIENIRNKTGIAYFHASLPEEKAYLVEMELPSNTRDLRQAIELHLEEQIPIEISKATFDYELIHSPADGKGDKFVVAVSALETNFASDYLEAFNKAGCTPLGFEFESQAIARAVVPKNKNGVLMIIDIGREQSNLSIVSNNIVRLTTSISMGGNAIAKAIEQDLKISPADALSMKENEGLSRRGKNRSSFDSIVRVASVLRDQIWERLIYWNTGRERSNPKDVISEVILCGGNANVPGLLEYLTSGINVPVSIGNPWSNILSFEKDIPIMNARESLKYCTALGLALRGSNV